MNRSAGSADERRIATSRLAARTYPLKRAAIMALTALVCTGCQGCQSSPRQPVDPFLSRSTVPPPPTGVIGPAGSVEPDSGGFLQRAPATNPATNNQFTPPESNNDLVTPPGINNQFPVGGSPGGYQTSAPPPQNTRWARAGRTAAPAPTTAGATQYPATTAAVSPAPGSNVQLASSSQAWQPATGGSPSSASQSQIQLVPTTSASSDPTDIMNLPPKSSSPAGGGSTM